MSGNGLRLHHVGVLVRDIEDSSANYVDGVGYEICTAIIHDPEQAARVRFFRLPGAADYLELIAPDDPRSHLHRALKGRPGIHHICHVTDDIEASLQQARKSRAAVLRPPTPAVAFRGLRVAWIMNSDGLVVEFVEAPALLLDAAQSMRGSNQTDRSRRSETV